jgi:ubiquitin-like protein Pup
MTITKRPADGRGGHPDAPGALWTLSSDQTQKQKPKGGDEGEAAKGDGPQKMAKRGAELKEEMDALVDEIDEVLEENAEEFVKNYVQRGGE